MNLRVPSNAGVSWLDEELSAFQEGLRSLQLVNNRMTATLHNDLSAEEISVHMPLFHSPKHLVFVLLVTPRCRFQEIIYDVRRFSLKTSNLKKWQGVRTKLIQSNVGSARHIDQTAVYRCHMIGLRTLHGFPTAKLVVLAEASCTNNSCTSFLHIYLPTKPIHNCHGR